MSKKLKLFLLIISGIIGVIFVIINNIKNSRIISDDIDDITIDDTSEMDIGE